MTSVTYNSSDAIWANYRLELESIVDRYQLKTVCDVGGGANPMLPVSFVRSRNLDYTVMDISQAELDKAPAEFKKRRQDILQTDRTNSSTYDFLFTIMLAEHVRDGELLHANIFKLLNPGGIAVHFFPTLYSLPFVINRFVPERAASWLLDTFAPRNRHKHEKFPAYYDWCRGPTPKMLKRLRGLGYEILEYRGLYGHDAYYKKIPIVFSGHRRLCKFLLRHPNPYMTSYAFVILRKPDMRQRIDAETGSTSWPMSKAAASA